jgi:hypothetical protein
VTAIVHQADGLLRPGAAGAFAPRARSLFVLILVFGVAYGAMMGLFYAPGQSPRGLQAVYSAIKVPLLLLLAFAIALPSFYVLNMLMGLAGDFGQAIRALLATQAGLTIVLASLGPFTLLFYASTTNYDAAILFNAMMFAIASLAGQRLLMRFYRPLIARNRRHRTMVRVWIVLYAFVGIQMGWVLRPFIGDPRTSTTFFREGAWGNAYVEVWEKAVGAWRGPDAVEK